MKPQHGDTIVIHNPFVWTDLTTYLAAIIRYFTKSYYNHSESIVEIKGELYSFGALANGYTQRSMNDFLEGKKLTDLLILRPKFDYNKETFTTTAISFIGRKYNYEGTLFCQLIYQVTKERLWVGAILYKKATRRLYCSEACACLYFVSGFEDMKNYYKTDPNELVMSSEFDKFEYTI